MGHFLGVDCQILLVASRDDFISDTTVVAVQQHFRNVGTPIMLGGDVKAYTILGIEVNEESDPKVVKYLILDPHYTGSDTNIKDIISKGWC